MQDETGHVVPFEALEREDVARDVVDSDEFQICKPLLSDAGLVPIIEKTRSDNAQKMINAAGPFDEHNAAVKQHVADAEGL